MPSSLFQYMFFFGELKRSGPGTTLVTLARRWSLTSPAERGGAGVGICPGVGARMGVRRPG